jgi:hypothetical protein
LSGLDDFDWSVKETAARKPHQQPSSFLDDPATPGAHPMDEEHAEPLLPPPGRAMADLDGATFEVTRSMNLGGPQDPAAAYHTAPDAEPSATIYHSAPEIDPPSFGFDPSSRLAEPLRPPPAAMAAHDAPGAGVLAVSTEQMEAMLQRQLEATLEKMAQKILPEIAERVIKQEIRRMLSEQPG